jgi:diketogulonate reductase-like aldo/keto reductase
MSDGKSLNVIIAEHWPRQESSQVNYIKSGKIRSLGLANFAKTKLSSGISTWNTL